MKNWYELDNPDTVDSPALLVYPERVKENIRVLKGMIDNPARLRPHIKTHKMASVTSLMIQEGIAKFKCATIAEAEMLGRAAAEDVLLAYQPSVPKLKRWIALIKTYAETAYSCLVDNELTAQMLSSEAVNEGLELAVFIDLNVGMDRTGIKPGTDAIALYHYCQSLPGVRVRGFHAYDGHIHERDWDKRKAECDDGYAPVDRMLSEMKAAGTESVEVVAGGTPTFPIHAARKDIDCSPGTFIFWDKGYQEICPEQAFLPAAVLFSRVVSLPGNKICLDLGHKSVASENPLPRRVHFMNAPDLHFVGHSEEHLVAETPDEGSWKTGDVLYGLPIHVCPTVALYERATLVEKGKVTGVWMVTARDRKLSI